MHDTPLSIAAPGVLSNDMMPPGTTVSLVSNPYHSSSFTFNTNGSFSSTPYYHYGGADSFIYRLTNGGMSDDATVSISVMNMAPTVGNDGPYGTKHDTQLNVSAPGVRSNDYDPNGDTFTISVVTPPTHSQTFTLNNDGRFS